ncbi:hypothetical protein ACLK19_11935 [Escherichia coli]
MTHVCITLCWISTMPVLSMVVKVSKTNYVQGANIAGFVKVAE